MTKSFNITVEHLYVTACKGYIWLLLLPDLKIIDSYLLKFFLSDCNSNRKFFFFFNNLTCFHCNWFLSNTIKIKVSIRVRRQVIEKKFFLENSFG